MKNIHFTLGCLALFAGTAFGQGATIASWDFNTDQSTSFTVRQFGDDYVANFNYDYGTYAVTAPTVGPAPIPAAPSGTGTKGLRLEATTMTEPQQQQPFRFFQTSSRLCQTTS